MIDKKFAERVMFGFKTFVLVLALAYAINSIYTAGNDEYAKAAYYMAYATFQLIVFILINMIQWRFSFERE